MSTETKVQNGGPAFPILGKWWNRDDGKFYEPYGGMSLRDYFAGKALAGMLAQPADEQNILPYDNPNRAAEWAYQFADAMLKAREGSAE